MPIRRAFLKHLPIAVVSMAYLTRSAEAADPPSSGGGGKPAGFDLKKQLETGLKARRPSDFSYIQWIVTKVENGSLPRKLVEESFVFARQQNSDYPIVYFQFCLKKLAQRAGVAL